MAAAGQIYPLSVVGRWTKIVRCDEGSDMPISDIAHLLRNERSRQLRQPDYIAFLEFMSAAR